MKIKEGGGKTGGDVQFNNDISLRGVANFGKDVLKGTVKLAAAPVVMPLILAYKLAQRRRVNGATVTNINQLIIDRTNVYMYRIYIEAEFTQQSKNSDLFQFYYDTNHQFFNVADHQIRIDKNKIRIFFREDYMFLNKKIRFDTIYIPYDASGNLLYKEATVEDSDQKYLPKKLTDFHTNLYNSEITGITSYSMDKADAYNLNPEFKQQINRRKGGKSASKKRRKTRRNIKKMRKTRINTKKGEKQE